MATDMGRLIPARVTVQSSWFDFWNGSHRIYVNARHAQELPPISSRLSPRLTQSSSTRAPARHCKRRRSRSIAGVCCSRSPTVRGRSRRPRSLHACPVGERDGRAFDQRRYRARAGHADRGDLALGRAVGRADGWPMSSRLGTVRSPSIAGRVWCWSAPPARPRRRWRAATPSQMGPAVGSMIWTAK